MTNAASTLLSTHEYATLSCSIPAEEDMFKWKVTGLAAEEAAEREEEHVHY